MRVSPSLRSAMAFAFCCVLSSVQARADLVITNVNSPSFVFTGSINNTDRNSPAFGGSFQFDPVTSLPQSNFLTSAFTNGLYGLTQSSGFADFYLGVNLAAPAIASSFDNQGIPFAFPAGSVAGLQIEFQSTIDETYWLSQALTGDNLSTIASSITVLFDVTAGQSLYFDNEYYNNLSGMTDSVTTGSDTGALLAGHVYYLEQVSFLLNIGDNTQDSTAFNSFEFSAAAPGRNPFAADFSPALAVPEPSSCALAGLGAIGLAFAALRRRQSV